MSGMNADDRKSRIEDLEVFRNVWHKMIEDNTEALARLRRLRLAGIKEYDQAIIRLTHEGVQLEGAKATIEATIERVRAGGE